MRIAHRAGMAHAPENSLEAIRTAAALGADAVELDVRMSRAGPICAHDRGQPGPPLADALDLALDLDLRVELDLKGHGFDGLVASICQAVSSREAFERIWATSFHPVTTVRLRLQDPRLVVGWAIAPSLVQRLPLWSGWPNLVQVQLIEPHASLATDDRLARWRAMGLGVVVWGIAPGAEAAWLERGVSVVVDDLEA